MLTGLQAQRHNLKEAIAVLMVQLAECGGDAYLGCWLDSATNRVGKSYTRLRWFGEGKKKSCRVLKGDEVGKATRAIALWQELEEQQQRLVDVERQIFEIQATAERLGLVAR